VHARPGPARDVQRDSLIGPLLGFILMWMIPARQRPGLAFVPARTGARAPADSISDLRAEHAGQVLACGRAGSLSSSNGPHGMATPQTHRAVNADRSKARLSEGRARRGPTSRPACDPRRARGLATGAAGLGL